MRIADVFDSLPPAKPKIERQYLGKRLLSTAKRSMLFPNQLSGAKPFGATMHIHQNEQRTRTGRSVAAHTGAHRRQGKRAQ